MNEEELYKMETCSFCRKKGGKWEVGILFNEGSGIILDKYGKMPEIVYDYRRGRIGVSIPVDLLIQHEEKLLK